MAVITSVSSSDLGSSSRTSSTLSFATQSQGGIYIVISMMDMRVGCERTYVNFSTPIGTHIPVGMPRGDSVASQW